MRRAYGKTIQGIKTITGGSCHTRLLSRQNVCRDKHIFFVTKRLFRQIFFATKIILLRPKFFGDMLTFVATTTCFSREIFVVTKILSRLFFLFW